MTEEVVVVGSGLFGLTAALTTALTTAPAAVLTAAKDGRRVLVFGHLAGREAAATPLKK